MSSGKMDSRQMNKNVHFSPNCISRGVQFLTDIVVRVRHSDRESAQEAKIASHFTSHSVLYQNVPTYAQQVWNKFMASHFVATGLQLQNSMPRKLCIALNW